MRCPECRSDLIKPEDVFYSGFYKCLNCLSEFTEMQSEIAQLREALQKIHILSRTDRFTARIGWKRAYRALAAIDEIAADALKEE